MKENIMLIFFLLLAIAIPNTSAAITEQSCDACTRSCPTGMFCYNFPEIGNRCADKNPCDYYQCPQGTKCEIPLRNMLGVLCPQANIGSNGLSEVKCVCDGPDCPDTSDKNEGFNPNAGNFVTNVDNDCTVTYDAETKTQTVGPCTGESDTNEENGGQGIEGGSGAPSTSKGFSGVTIKSGSVQAYSKEKITFEEDKVYMQTEEGRKEIKIMPNELPSEVEGTIENIIIEEVNSKPVYSIKTTKKGKFLFIIPVTGTIETKISAENKEIVSIKKPMWSFLAKDI